MPSFATDSPLDARVKRGLLADCLKTLSLSNDKKVACKKEIEDKIRNRLLKPAKTVVIDEVNDGKTAEERVAE